MPSQKLFITVTLLFNFLAFSSAQSDKIVRSNTNAWFVYIGTHKIAPRWSIVPEVQYRRNNFLANPMQLLLRFGIMHHINENVSLTAGYLHVTTDEYGALPAKAEFPENRTWQQLQTRFLSGRFEIVNRYRLEQRWVNSPIAKGSGWEAGDAIYSNRFRLQSRMSVPLTGKSIQNKTIYAVAWDEMFVQWGKNIALNTWDQNRAFIGLGYRMPKFGRIEVGYLNQRIFKSDARTIENNHTFSVWALSNIDFYKKKA